MDPFAAVVLAGGRGRRLGGQDKAALRIGPETLLDRALAAVDGADPVVVVGPDSVARPGVRQVQEDPPYGGPAAGLLTALATLTESTAADDLPVAVVPVDQPALTASTVARLRAAARADGAVLVDDAGRRQPVLVARLSALRRVAPGREEWPGLSLRWLLEPLDLVKVTALGDEAADVDTPDDVRRWTT